jgi:hypothetical protein
LNALRVDAAVNNAVVGARRKIIVNAGFPEGGLSLVTLQPMS